jgi:hypothetical protein
MLAFRRRRRRLAPLPDPRLASRLAILLASLREYRQTHHCRRH